MKLFKLSIALFFALSVTLLSHEAGAWTETVNFENGTVTGTDGFDGSTGSEVYINSNSNYVQNGSYSARVHFSALRCRPC